MPVTRASIAAALLSSPAAACTLCLSDTATMVREAVLGPDLLANLAAVLLVFPALALAVALLRRATP